jgi:hypothetical protein
MRRREALVIKDIQKAIFFAEGQVSRTVAGVDFQDELAGNRIEQSEKRIPLFTDEEESRGESGAIRVFD